MAHTHNFSIMWGIPFGIMQLVVSSLRALHYVTVGDLDLYPTISGVTSSNQT